MDGSPMHRIVHLYGRIYEVPRERKAKRRIRAIWIWQGTYGGDGHKREIWHR